MTRAVAILRLALWVGMLAAGLAGAHRAAVVVPLSVRTAGTAWMDQDAIVAIGFGLLRLAVLATGWYLLGTTALCALARFGRSARAAACVDRWSLPPVRRLVASALGLSVAMTAISSPVGPALAAESPVTMRLLTGDEGNAGGRDEAAVVMRRIEPDTAVSPERVQVAPPSPPSEWTVEHGDHLWSIAARVLTRTWGRPPTDREVDPYWRRLVDRNRPRLVDVDLLFPGDRIEIPDPPAVP